MQKRKLNGYTYSNAEIELLKDDIYTILSGVDNR